MCSITDKSGNEPLGIYLMSCVLGTAEAGCTREETAGV